MSVMTSREFNQKTSEAKKLARKGPVFITDRGEIGYVLMSYEDFRRRGADEPSIIDLLTMPDAMDIDFEPPKLDNIGIKPAEFD
ncbi:Antitoxin Phd_YefM, type II toxin-antitoxin system [Ensifer adhaerens]|nr:Antitoxin Phd_YefM, type II toxin-antitoxin system [Ensifer adhaerens]